LTIAFENRRQAIHGEALRLSRRAQSTPRRRLLFTRQIKAFFPLDTVKITLYSNSYSNI
jgi:hypothetical protein